MKRSSVFNGLILILASLLFSACRQGTRPTQIGSEAASTASPAETSTIEALTFHVGRNDYTVNVDGYPRDFIIYVPAAYDASQATPLVFMFHGTNQGGPLMYENTRWVQEADEGNLIVIFPTSWKYPLVGETGLHTKWNDVSLVQLAEAGTELRDDVHFTRVMLDLARLTFNIDAKRTYATGFSNGGLFVSNRLMPEMSDVFGAFAVCGAGIRTSDMDLMGNISGGQSPSYYTIIGTNDEKISEGAGHPRPFPLDAAAILADALFGPTLVNTATALSLDPGQYQLIGNNPNFTIFIFNHSTLGADNEYVFQMVGGMGHVYPSVDNNRYQLNAAKIFWEFFKRHPLK